MRETVGGQEFYRRRILRGSVGGRNISRRRFLRKFGGAGFDRRRILRGTGDGRYRPPPESLRNRRCRICRRRILREDGNCARSTKAAASMAAAWACCCFKTGMHAAWHDAASKPDCMLHDMLLLQNRDACCMTCCCFSSSSCCCVHACVRGCLRDRHHISADTSAQTQAWRIEFPYRNIREEWTRKKGRAREAASRARPSVRVH